MPMVDITTFILKAMTKDTKKVTSGRDRVQNHIACVPLLTDSCI